MCLLALGMVVLLFYHFTLALLRLESLLVTGGLFFLAITLLVRLLTWQPKIRTKRDYPPLFRR
jgi:hypothetical protein